MHTIVQSLNPYIPTCWWSLRFSCCAAEGVTEECTLRVLLLTLVRYVVGPGFNSNHSWGLFFFFFFLLIFIFFHWPSASRQLAKPISKCNLNCNGNCQKYITPEGILYLITGDVRGFRVCSHEVGIACYKQYYVLLAARFGMESNLA